MMLAALENYAKRYMPLDDIFDHERPKNLCFAIDLSLILEEA